jgi:hypothetical protein
VRYILDEQLSAKAAAAMSTLGAPDEYVHIHTIKPGRSEDEDIPALSKEHGFDCVVSINVKDFGARKHIFEATLAAGRHVVVLRTQKGFATTSGWQVSRLALYHDKITRYLSRAEKPTLLSLTASGFRPMTLEQILAEIEDEASGKSKLP